MKTYVVRKQVGIGGTSLWPGAVTDGAAIGDTADSLEAAGYIEFLSEVPDPADPTPSEPEPVVPDPPKKSKP